MSPLFLASIVTVMVLLGNRRLKALTFNLEQRIHKLQNEHQ